MYSIWTFWFRNISVVCVFAISVKLLLFLGSIVFSSCLCHSCSPADGENVVVVGGGGIQLKISSALQEEVSDLKLLSAHARTAYRGLLQKGLEGDLCWIIPHSPPPPPVTQSIKGLNCRLLWVKVSWHMFQTQSWRYFLLCGSSAFYFLD